ncbi:hypothetical protein D3H65_05650 [Paraflavitalea soli]|uniref:Uncharacterized protein n=1 Tax=Paraflavitalea soli TaxID=2315862 RepID=A0A3B7MGJ6_9BACT|nr:hypothetical protein [Paraflavitalea soli]AXY73492.1 hypothetical protein D3H65_05650 [Paraflavitalea soli]
MRLPKLFYTPGLISLLALPLLIMYLVTPFGEQQYAIRMFLPSDEKPPKGQLRFSKYSVWEAAKNKKIVEVQFFFEPHSQFDQFNQRAKLDFVRREIERLTITHDTNSVLKLELGEGITYGELVWIFDQLMIYGVKRYAWTDDSFYIFANEPQVRPEPLEEIHTRLLDL